MSWVSFAADQAVASAGAGLSGYVDSSLRAAMTPVGSAWDVRFAFGARSRLTFEAEYLGTYASLTAAGAAPYLVSNGVTAQARLNFTLSAWQPFVFVGAGYDRAELHARAANPDAAASFADRADRFALPVGLGFDVTFVRHLSFDLRASYRALFGPSLIKDARDDQWLVTTHVGYAF